MFYPRLFYGLIICFVKTYILYYTVLSNLPLSIDQIIIKENSSQLIPYITLSILIRTMFTMIAYKSFKKWGNLLI